MENLKIIKSRYNPNDNWVDMESITIPNPSMTCDIFTSITRSYPEREEKLRIRKERINKILNHYK